jgi:hypothetical protein
LPDIKNTGYVPDRLECAIFGFVGGIAVAFISFLVVVAR